MRRRLSTRRPSRCVIMSSGASRSKSSNARVSERVKSRWRSAAAAGWATNSNSPRSNTASTVTPTAASNKPIDKAAGVKRPSARRVCQSSAAGSPTGGGCWAGVAGGAAMGVGVGCSASTAGANWRPKTRMMTVPRMSNCSSSGADAPTVTGNGSTDQKAAGITR